MIRDRIVIGIHKENVRKILLRENKLTLAKTIQVCQIHEVSEKDAHEIQPQKEVNMVRKKVPGARTLQNQSNHAIKLKLCHTPKCQKMPNVEIVVINTKEDGDKVVLHLESSVRNARNGITSRQYVNPRRNPEKQYTKFTT
jgi:hypothetical protein